MHHGVRRVIGRGSLGPRQALGRTAAALAPAPASSGGRGLAVVPRVIRTGRLRGLSGPRGLGRLLAGRSLGGVLRGTGPPAARARGPRALRLALSVPGGLGSRIGVGGLGRGVLVSAPGPAPARPAPAPTAGSDAVVIAGGVAVR